VLTIVPGRYASNGVPRGNNADVERVARRFPDEIEREPL